MRISICRACGAEFKHDQRVRLFCDACRDARSCASRKAGQKRRAKAQKESARRVPVEKCAFYVSRAVPGDAPNDAMASKCRRAGFADVCRVTGICRFVSERIAAKWAPIIERAERVRERIPT